MKKILVMACSVIILAAIAISGTIAYFTDSDNATNVFTVGNVVIDLIEQQRDENGELEDFEDDKNLMPIVGTTDAKDDLGLPTASNFVDKIVTVTNTGKSDAYVRVYVGVPAELDNKEALHFVRGTSFNNATSNSYTFIEATDKIKDQTVNGVVYNFYCFTLNGALPEGDTTGAAIVGFYLDSKVDYKDEDKSYYIGDKNVNANKLNFDLSQNVEIPVYVQAVQTAGFNDSATAFSTAFTQYPWGGSSSTTPSATPAPGSTVDTNNLSTLQPSTSNENTYEISTAAELFAFAKMVNDGTDFNGKTVKLMDNISLSDQQQWTPIGQLDDNTPGNYFKGTFDGNNKTIYHLTFDFSELDNDGKQNIYNNYDAQGLFGYCEGTIQNLTLDGASIIGIERIGGIAGYLGSGSITNCKVNNSEIKGFYNTDFEQYDAIAGAIVGQAEENAELKNCTASNCNVYGLSDGKGESGTKNVGTIAGMAYDGTVDDDCSAPNCKAYYRDGETDSYHTEKVGKYEYRAAE